MDLPQVTSIENYMRLTCQNGSKWFDRSNVTGVVLLIWLVGFVASGLQFAYNISFNYCNRKSNQHLSSFETGEQTFMSVYIGQIGKTVGGGNYDLNVNICKSSHLNSPSRCARGISSRSTSHHLLRAHSNHYRRKKVYEPAKL